MRRTVEIEMEVPETISKDDLAIYISEEIQHGAGRFMPSNPFFGNMRSSVKKISIDGEEVNLFEREADPE